MWAVPTSQSLFFSTLLGRVQFRSIDFADQKEVVSTSIRQLIDFLDHAGHAHQSISLFLDAREKTKKFPKPRFNLLKLALGIFEWIRNNNGYYDLEKLAGSHINLRDAKL